MSEVITGVLLAETGLAFDVATAVVVGIDVVDYFVADIAVDLPRPRTLASLEDAFVSRAAREIRAWTTEPQNLAVVRRLVEAGVSPAPEEAVQAAPSEAEEDPKP